MTDEEFYKERITDPDWKEWRDEELWTVREEPDDYEINAVYEKLATVENDIEDGDLIVAPKSKWVMYVWKSTIETPVYFIRESKPYLEKADGKWKVLVSEDAINEDTIVVAVFDTEKEALDAKSAISVGEKYGRLLETD